jgi:hypothetical protein
MSPTRSRYKELGLELVSLEEKISHTQTTSHGRRKERQWDMRSLQNISQGIPHATEE